ncbi:MAG TPA: 30S ribosomal protein S27ae [Nitrososphaerales archaeon]|nr:30S ribosomal protein S27ae [Nitrososphaerales archaeon]
MSQAKAPAAPAPPAPAPAEAPAGEEKKPEKKEKPKAPKRRIQVHKLYKVEGQSLLRLRKECPRCGKGYFMAEHKNRLTCGNCGYTTYTQKTQP